MGRRVCRVSFALVVMRRDCFRCAMLCARVCARTTDQLSEQREFDCECEFEFESECKSEMQCGLECESVKANLGRRCCPLCVLLSLERLSWFCHFTLFLFRNRKFKCDFGCDYAG